MVADKVDFLNSVVVELLQGTYFSSIEDVWEPQPGSLDTVNVTLFDRTYDMLEYMPETGYKNTIDGANVETDDTDYMSTINGASDATSVATLNSARTPVDIRQDIFGVANTAAQNAHLMPHSKRCASLWYYLVPWVLCRLEDSIAKPGIAEHDRNHWVFLQKCIHGFALQQVTENTPPPEECETTKNVASCVGKPKVDDNDNDEVGSDASDTKPPAKNLQSGTGAFEPPAKKTKREDGVGIKHFKSNRVRLLSQQHYLDTYHCLLIVPILTVEEVKSWKGSGYSAIVLAGDYINENHNISAVEVYHNISADRGKVLFADPNELELARTLLENMILCVCKSSKDTPSTQFQKTLKEKYYNKLELKACETAYPKYIERNTINVPVPTPTSNHWNNLRVRKVTFSDVSGENPAPDPVLLLGKATSNWLKRQGLFVLPGYDEDESSSDSSDFVASLRDEFALRGWSYDMVTRPPHVEGIVEVTCRPEDVEEPLSDIDDDDDE